MKMILFNQNPMIEKLLESVSKKLELSIENFNHYQELSARLKKDPEWLLIADDECLEKLDQVDWLELKEIISQNKNSVCMYKKGNEAQPFLEGFEMKIKKPFLPTEMLKVLQKKLGSNTSELEPSQNLDPTQEVLETNWDELENLSDLEALAKEEPNAEEQLLPTLDVQEEKEEVKKEEKEEVKKEEKEEVKKEEKEEVKKEEKEEVKKEEKEEIKDDETQEGDETPKDEEVSKELETQEELEIPKEETQEEVKEEIKEEVQEEVQEEVKEETQEIKEEKQEETQDSPSAQELEAMQELVKEIQENSNENKEETQESAEALQETQAQELEKQENAETPQEKEKQEDTGTPQELEIPQAQEKETPQEETQETQEKEMPQTQDEKPQEDHYESIEDIPEPVMAKAMGEELPFLNEAVAKTPNNENDTETPKESVTETSKNENATETPQEKEESDKTSSPLELRLNLQDLLKSLNQESLKSLLENKTLSIKITLEDKKPNA
ncbi:hypothetical protein [Helicobacter pylori]|uniref:hypothetical protein n=1 Tax=Helicobacter pylori TaxID=210 RepID=UPI00165B2B16|nr:hypothetical protein [Helicobacter pylori]